MLDRRFSVLALVAFACAKVGGSNDQTDDPNNPNNPPPPPPPVTCPAIALADVNAPTTVVGDGTPGSCTEAEFKKALDAGGVITFKCGDAKVTIQITSEKVVRTDVNTVIDGGDKVTLDGAGASRLLVLRADSQGKTPTLRLQRLTLMRGHVNSSTPFPEAGGAAVYHSGGTLEVVGCTFQDNAAVQSGNDIAGGAIYGYGGDTTIANSVFSGNSAASGGAVGVLVNALTVVNVLFDSNAAKQQNGGAMSMDGMSGRVNDFIICESQFTNNTAAKLGSAIFRTAYQSDPTAIDRSLFQGNTAGQQGTVYLMGNSLTMTATTVAGNNGTNGAGGIWLSSHNGYPGPAWITNTTIANNDAGSSLGGALWLDSDEASIVLTHVTIAGNHALFQGGIGGSGSTRVVYRDTIIADNTATLPGNEISCYKAGTGSVMQWPQYHGEKHDLPEPQCASSVVWQDPLLQPLADNGGPTPTMALSTGSPAIGVGTYCTDESATDQRGHARPATNCALGAYQP